MLFEVTHVNSSICSAFRKRNKTKSCGMGRPCFDEGGSPAASADTDLHSLAAQFCGLCNPFPNRDHLFQTLSDSEQVPNNPRR
jgi:hypothetical protein